MSPGENRTLQDVGIEEILQDPKASRIDAVFLNRKPLQVRYYFEDKGAKELIMIHVDSLLPIFGGFRPAAAGPYETLDKLSAFVKNNIHFDKCSSYSYADCVCHLIENRADPFLPVLKMSPPSDCSLRHFHHACWSCVHLWLNEYLRVLILRQESKPLFAKAAQEICLRVYIPDDFEEYFNRDYPEFYLRIAQRWTIPDYLLDNMIDPCQ
ncbi:repeat element protein-e2.3 [Ichnoviriform fugitivi]|uniref:Repeat element protein-e2.3 n=1 Tax=Ichnoviriform fugitivi TaxID=265522 RepID=A2Q0P3_9VIRU|nr:repeat element protein-e2.3 [Ichnoviriform fugitivi]BAF45758.1 repeat element protein-e2.3 [Ichnoviriform fugitivi]